MIPRSLPLAPGRRTHVVLIALSALVFHAWLAGRLAGVQASLAATLGNEVEGGGAGGRGGDDARDLEGVEWRRLEGVRALLGIGRLWSWCSSGVAGVGIYGLLKDRLPLLRLFALNGFLSLALDVLLLILILLLLTVSSPSSDHGLGTALCQALSSSPAASSSLSLSFGLPDLLGLSLEACEDRFEGVVVSALSTLAIVEGLRAWGALKVLSFYAARASPRIGRRRGSSGRHGAGELDSARGLDRFYDSPVELDSPSGQALGRSGSGKKKRRDSHNGRRERSASGSSPGRRRDETRIFLLPRPEDRGSHAGEAQGEVPLLALTASSPTHTSFPPAQQGLQPPMSPARDGRRVLVYAPVMVSPDEARSLGATELVLQRSCRTYPPVPGHPPASSTSSTATRSPRSRSSTITPGSSTASTSSSTLVVETAVQPRSAAPSSREDSDDTPTPVGPHQPLIGTTSGGDVHGGDGRAKRA